MLPRDQEDEHRPPPDHRSAGLRRLTPAMIPPAHLAEQFAGGSTTPGQILAAFKAAAPYLETSPSVVHAIDWLFRFTQPQDWLPGARPIVWPSAEMQATSLMITLSQTKRLNRHLAELGLVVMHDSPNRKRWGKRDPKGRITEAYGFDLSPLALRIEEFRALAEAGRQEREAISKLRRRASIARMSLRQTWETYREQKIVAPPKVVASAKVACRALKGLHTSKSLAPTVATLEAVAADARHALEEVLVDETTTRFLSTETVEMRRSRRMDAPHIITTNPDSDPEVTTASTLKPCSPSQTTDPIPKTPVLKHPNHPVSETKISPGELVRIAPALGAYLTHPRPAWPEIVDAADWLRHDLGISKPLWGEACLTMGREEAAIAVALVSTRPASHFRSGPGGYFHAMVARARMGSLYLDRTIWAIRRQERQR